MTDQVTTPTATTPDLTAVTGLIRALYAAGWQADYATPMGGDRTDYALAHGTGRTISAEVHAGGHDIRLTLTGLTLEQAVGAVTGAGLAPTAEAPAVVDDPTPGPSYFAAVDQLQAAVHELITRDIDDPRGWISHVAAKSGALAAEQAKLAAAGAESEPTEPGVREALADRLHRIAADLVTKQLPLGGTMCASLGLGVLDSRADLEQWARYLGSTIDTDPSNNIPHTNHTFLLAGRKYGPQLRVGAQIRADEPSEVERLRARVAELEAARTEGGVR